MRFEGTSGYVATDDLKVAVNAAIALMSVLAIGDTPPAIKIKLRSPLNDRMLDELI